MLISVAVISLLTLSMAGLVMPGEKRLVNIIYAVDVSRSIGRDSLERVLRFVGEAAKGHSEAQTGGVILFGDGSKSLSASGTGDLMASDKGLSALYGAGPMAGGTDISHALRRAEGYFKDGAANRVVLFTDGRQTRGNALAAAKSLRSMDGEFFVAPVDKGKGSNEVAVESLRAPARARAMEPFELVVNVKSDGPAEARLDVLRDGLISVSREVKLGEGVTEYSFMEVVREEGFHHYRAMVYPSYDGMKENNGYEAFVEVERKTGILLAYGEEEEARFVRQALQTQGFSVVSGDVGELPPRYQDYTGYAAVILQNVSGLGVSGEKMELLEKYVKDAGGGLVVIGGDKSLGAGYHQTPLERALPVSMDSPSGLTVPGVALVLLIDKSDSMSARVGKTDKLELAKIATYNAVELLRPFDRVGLLAFDAHFFWAVPMIRARERGRIAERLRTVQTGGGTDLYPALEEAYRQLRKEQPAIKHVLILSDGLTEDKGFDRLVEEMASDKITVSTVAMGSDADLTLMERLAQRGGGRFYFARNPQEVPTIFLTEAMIISRKIIVEGDIDPLPGDDQGLLQGIEPLSLPHLKGYTRTYPKSTSRVVLASPQGDPLLAAWQYGLGKAAVFTSDLSRRWGTEWVRWEEFGKFVAQLVRWVSSPHTEHRVKVSREIAGGEGRLLVDLFDRENDFINLVDLKGKLTGPDSTEQGLSFTQSAPGRYESDFEANLPGLYFLNLHGNDGVPDLRTHTTGFTLPYRAEYASWGIDREFLRELAMAGGGKIVELSELKDEIYRPTRKRGGIKELWHLLALAALICYVLNIVIIKWPRTQE